MNQILLLLQYSVLLKKQYKSTAHEYGASMSALECDP